MWVEDLVRKFTCYSGPFEPDQDGSHRSHSLPVHDTDQKKETVVLPGSPTLADPKKLETFEDTQLSSLIPEMGTDALAYYVPFHSSPIHWGIYILDSGLLFLAKEMLRQGMTPAVRCVEIAYKVLLNHEFFHHISEVGFTVLEMTIPYPCYDHKERSRHGIEEALANAFAWSKTGRRRQVRAFFDQQPPGYRDYYRYTCAESLSRGLGELADVVRLPFPIPDFIFDVSESRVNRKEVPTYLVRTGHPAVDSLKYVCNIAANKIRWTSRFRRDYDNLTKKGAVQEDRVDEQIALLAVDIHHPSLHFERIQGHSGCFSFRVDDSYRISLGKQERQEVWYLLRMDAHDALYANPGKLS